MKPRYKHSSIGVTYSPGFYSLKRSFPEFVVYGPPALNPVRLFLRTSYGDFEWTLNCSLSETELNILGELCVRYKGKKLLPETNAKLVNLVSMMVDAYE